VSTYCAPYYGCQGVPEESSLVGSDRSFKAFRGLG
jgi:hypothetical protein